MKFRAGQLWLLKSGIVARILAIDGKFISYQAGGWKVINTTEMLESIIKRPWAPPLKRKFKRKKWSRESC